MPGSPANTAAASSANDPKEVGNSDAPATVASSGDHTPRPRLRSAPAGQNRSPSPELPSPSLVQQGSGLINRAVLPTSGEFNPIGGDSNRTDVRVASLIDAPLRSSGVDEDDERRFVAEHPAASDSGGRAVSRVGSSVTSRESHGNPRGLIGRRRERGSLSTYLSKRFRPLRQCEDHSGLARWDCLSFSVRSSLAGHKRKIFDTTRLLVSRVDLQLYRMLREHEPQQTRRIFPRAPGWWRLEWGRFRIVLPLEVSLHRGRLVDAAPNAAVWVEMHQLFLQQLAAGWDLEWVGADGSGQAHILPHSLAEGIIEAGGFAFLPESSRSLEKFLSLHGISADQCTAQRDARSRKWGVIRQTFEMERLPRQVEPSVPKERDVASPDDPLAVANRGARLSDLVTEVLGGAMHLNLERPDVLCAVSSASLQVLQTVDKTRVRVMDLLASVKRHTDPDLFHLQLEQLAGSLPTVALHLIHYFTKAVEQIRSVTDSVSRSVASRQRRE